MKWRRFSVLARVLLIAVAALVVLGCGPTSDSPAQSTDFGLDGGVLPPATERPPQLAGWLELPGDVHAVVFPYSEVVVEREAGQLDIGVLVANNGERRSRGMMYWTGLPPRMGMIFIWGEIAMRRGGFWNPNVPIDLDVAWLAADGTIQEFSILLANDSTVKAPESPYAFVMEMPRGRFAELAIGVGDRVVIPDALIASGE